MIATDKSAPFETPLDLAAGDYKIGFCHRKDGVQKCETTEPGTGIVARVTVADASAPPPPAPDTTTTGSTPAPTTGALHLAHAHRLRRAEARSPDRRHRREELLRRGSVGQGTRQRARRRLRCLPQRQDRRYDAADAVHVRQPRLWHRVHGRSRRIRRGRQSLFARPRRPSRRLHARRSSPRACRAGSSSRPQPGRRSCSRGCPRTTTSASSDTGCTSAVSRSARPATHPRRSPTSRVVARTTIGIDAVDAAGNRSARASAYFSTSLLRGLAGALGAGRSGGERHDDERDPVLVPVDRQRRCCGYGVYRGSSRVATTTADDDDVRVASDVRDRLPARCGCVRRGG